VKADVNRFVLRRDNEAVELLLNSDMEGSRLLSVDSDKEIAKKARGRPDISLWKIKDGERKGLLVIECKFSDSPPYLTAGSSKPWPTYTSTAPWRAPSTPSSTSSRLWSTPCGACASLGQSVVPMRRIMETSEGRQEVKAAAL
jgi:hypothetical protein